MEIQKAIAEQEKAKAEQEKAKAQSKIAETIQKALDLLLEGKISQEQFDMILKKVG